MTYTEPSICPCCGTKTYVQITAYGDYDGPDSPRETDPRNCPTCEGIRIASPDMHKRLIAMWDMVLKERQKCAKRIKWFEKNTFARHDLVHPFFNVFMTEKLKKFWDAKISELNACTDDKNGEWVIGKALLSLAFECAKIIEKQKS